MKQAKERVRRRWWRRLRLPLLVLLCYLVGLTYVAKQENLGHIRNVWPLAFLSAPVVYAVALALEEPRVWLFSLLPADSATILSPWICLSMWM